MARESLRANARTRFLSSLVELRLMPAILEYSSLSAPERLIAETRVDFRSAVLEKLAQAGATTAGSLTIDMTETRDIDASGLGILVLVQKRARERGIPIYLRNPQQQIRSLLAMTKLEGLFQYA